MKNNKKIIIILILIISIIFLLYIIGFIKINNKQSSGIAILAYHHFMKEEDKIKYEKDNYFVMSTEKFEEQIKYLAKNGYNSLKPDEIICYIEGKCKIPKKSYIVTIDDGNISSYYEALPILEKYNVNSINFIIVSRVGEKSSKLNPPKYNFVGEDILKKIESNSKTMTIGSHSYGLHDLIDGQNPINVLSYDKILGDVKKSKDFLNNTKFYAYPFGNKNETYEKAIKEAGYKAAFTFKDNRKAKKGDNLYAIPRIEIRGDVSLEGFINKIEGKITLKEYTKKIIKRILNRE